MPWLEECGVSLAFSTYQAGKLFFVGRSPGDALSVYERSFDRCMGLHWTGERLWMSSLCQIWEFVDFLEPEQEMGGYDALFVPVVAHTTGDLDAHDLAVDAKGRLLFANTLFSCLATLSDRHSFVPVWQPPFVSRLAAEDRCHLNGLALRDGAPRYMTALSRTDVVDGWRDGRRDAGVLLDVQENQVLADGLCMPHSPRWYRDRLWLLNSGTGEFGWLDVAAGRFEPVAFLPGYLRGLAFVGDYAVMATSKAREHSTFSELPVGERLRRQGLPPRCGLYVVDLRSGDVVHWVRLDGVVEELYDVVAIPGVRRPMAIGVRSDEIRRTISVGPAA